MIRLVIDTDPGVDDSHAIMLAAAYAQCKIEAITTVCGNVSLDRTTANACKVLDALGIPPSQTPVYAGADRALLGHAADAGHVHGTDGLGDSGIPPSSRPVEKEHGALALVRLANENPGELILLAIAPLTNVALATRLDPELPRKFKRLVVMGGAIRGTGNMHNPTAEFNVGSDPEAASIVFENWPGLTLLSWETTMNYMLSEEQVNLLLNAPTPRGEFFRRISGSVVNRIRTRLGRVGLFTPDELAMAIALESDIATRCERKNVVVETAGTYTRGQTTVDWFNNTERQPNVEIVLDVNAPRFFELMKASVGI